MCAQNFGRIILTSSIAGVYSEKNLAGYAVTKAGLVGLSNVLAHEGAAHGVHANAILPSAETRLSEGRDTSMFPDMRAELVAPMVAWLCHEKCTVNGEQLVALAGASPGRTCLKLSASFNPNGQLIRSRNAGAKLRNSANSVTFPPVPSGFNDHLAYSFAMARAG